MSTSMFRVLLVLAAIPLGFVYLDSQRSGGLIAAGSVDSVFSKPTIELLGAPERMILDEAGIVVVRATAPAVPGDEIRLETAGAYGLGYNVVSRAVLDDSLQATLEVAPRRFLGTYKYWAKIPATATYQEAKSATFPITIEASTAPLRPTCGGVELVKASGRPWVCTYHDEFDEPSLNRRFWATQTAETTGTKTNFACALDDPQTIDVVGGNLELSLVELPETRSCGRDGSSRYVYGQVMHFQTYSQTYGKYEVRAKIPDVTGPGSQQSFWLWPKSNTYGPWPASGEIDFAELYSSTPGVVKPFMHYLPGETESGTNKNLRHVDCPIRVGEFNTYGVEWQPRRVTFLVNGDVCFINDYSSIAAPLQGKNSPFDKPFYLAMNQAMGNIGNEYDPDLMPERLTTQIDYVRIWK